MSVRHSAFPAVSVVMSVYNEERFLREAIDSVLAQSFRNLELVVVDDGSTDSTAQILAEYASSDPRLVIHRQENHGPSVARNSGCELARGPLIAHIDADDVAMPDRLERQHRFLSKHESVALVGGAVRFMDEGGHAFADVQYPLSDAEIRTAFETTTPFAHSAVMLRRAAFERVGGYRPIFDPAEDTDLWLRMAEHYELANLSELVVAYRMHKAQASVRRLELQALHSLAARSSARARMAGQPDPFDAAERIDRQTLLAHGTSDEEITVAFVRSATWLAKTMARAGEEDVAEELFTNAEAKTSGMPDLAANVHDARARVKTKRPGWLRARLRAARAGFRTKR
jgi:cellulose synthase/poly-beta-1,6-N-acetylglucosamine synthase-like glycosyltransferase